MEKLKDYILCQVAEKKLSAEQAFEYLEDLEKTPNPTQNENVEFAVIGMAARLPKAPTLESFWDNLIHCRDAVDAFPKERMDDVKYVNSHTYELFKDFQCRTGAYFDQIDLFDHTFFKLTPAEARVMDPNQRIFLETAVEALENAGLTEEDLKGSNTGVFVGYSVNEDNYVDILSKNDPNVALGNQPSLLAYRLSFLYDMRGPTMIIDTACSSSLVAVHQACQSILLGDCDQAIVGGVNVRIFPAIREVANLGIEAFDGRCKTFDEKANGTNIGDGVTAIVIKRKELAKKNGDYIHAIIKGSAVNSDGGSNGLTAPNPEAQAAVLQAAWKKSGINPEEIAFIETHGTGTKLGDPIEVLGLTQAFAKSTDKKQFCALGAVKTNIGHLEASSGMAGLIKAILSIKNRQLPPNIHYQNPNPYINFKDSAVFPNATFLQWKEDIPKLIAGVSSFGISGTNCHLVIEEYMQPLEDLDAHTSAPVYVFSTKDSELLVPLLTKHLEWIKGNPQTSLRDIRYTLAKGRNHYEHRVAIVAQTRESLIQKMELFIEGSFVQEDSVSELPRLYLQNQEIDWCQYFPKGSGRKIPLPTYAFQQRRHWPKLEVEKIDTMEARLRSIFYQNTWQEETSLGFATIPQGKCFLCFMLHDEKQESFVNFIEAQGVEVLRVYPGEAFSVLGEKSYSIAVDVASDYDALIDLIMTSTSLLFGGVIHLWDCIFSTKNFDSWNGVKDSQLYGTFSSFHLIRSIQKHPSQTQWKFITLVSNAHKVCNNDQVIDPMKMPALGINKVISQEMPLVQSVAFDVELHSNVFLPLFNDIFRSDDFTDAVIAYREGKRYVQVLERKDIDSLAKRKVFLREDGVYLIAGGAGYLGLSTARFLAERKRVKIALIGRKDFSSLTVKQRNLMQEIEKLGSEVFYTAGDVTDLSSCQSVIDRIEEKWGTIHGIFVAMKNISHQRIEDVSFERLSSNILAKVQGTWLLDSLTQKMPVDFMATFSSISSLTGGPTGADCSASNLFLDSFGDWRNSQGRSTITMNYTLIEADDGSLLSDRMSMIPAITKEEFLRSLEICLTKELDFAAIADFNAQVLHMVLPFMKVRFSESLLRELGSVKPEAPQIKIQTKSDLTFDEIVVIMKQIWEDVLGYEEIETAANFFEIGGESISAVKLLHLAKVQLQVSLEIADLYSYPVLENLCRFIEDRLNKKSEPKLLSQILEDFESGKIDLTQTLSAYEQIH